ncbi:MAG: Fe-S cluster assembly sulfur transfer protein SufU [Catonella sp.]|uniref:Fe-S cluster assembly sulfur transfer protein SufU n=1 Tax=Catonella sp. TaxID=2382125 RepID=UPI003FA186E3
MELRSIYNEILTEHNMHPNNKQEIENPTIELRGVNPSCGDDITLKLQIEDNVVVDGGYTGTGCAISQASADMMLDLVIGKEKEEALRLSELFMGMIRGEVKEDEVLLELDEAIALRDIAHMPARVKCAVLGWRTLGQMLGKKEE